MTGSFQRYLRAKRTVDDRALDRRVIERLREALSARAAASDGPLRVLEIGAGIGTMLTRALEWELFPPGDVRYTAVDVQAENVAELRRHVTSWAEGRDISVLGGQPLVLEGPERHITVEPAVAEAVAYADRSTTGYDLLVGVALLDILDLEGLGTLLGALAPGGLYYFPITFDGATRFRPSHPADRAVERRYHEHMDAKSGGSSRAGGDVLARLQDRDGSLLDVAGSDWVVRPTGGTYPADEAYFLRYILDTIEDAVGEITDEPIQGLEEWLSRRRAQVEAGELTYHTHQLDFLGRVEGASPRDST
ncbi:MAG: class I SAM-dependent methyltransferase [Haloarculaceae archaeon]